MLVKLNVDEANLDAVIALLPALKSPTVSKLFGEDGYAVETVVAKREINTLIPALKDAGATGIIELPISQDRPLTGAGDAGGAVAAFDERQGFGASQDDERARATSSTAPRSPTARARSTSARPSSSTSSPAASAAGRRPSSDHE